MEPEPSIRAGVAKRASPPPDRPHPSADERSRWLALLHHVARIVDEAPAWVDAVHRVLGLLCETEGWEVGLLYLPHPDVAATMVPVIGHTVDQRYQPFLETCERQQFHIGEAVPGQVFAAGAAQWVAGSTELGALFPRRAADAKDAGMQTAVAFPVALGGHSTAVLELFSTRMHRRSPELDTVLGDVVTLLAQILEREQMADLVWREQQSLLHTLHDSLGQSLTGVGMLAQGLAHRCEADPEAADVARQIAREAQRALQQVRELAKDVFPVDVDAERLLTALGQLAASTESLHKVAIRVEGDSTGPLPDSRLATQLYHLAQEAVTNAVKHASAHAIVIRLQIDPDATILQVIDDGSGLQAPIGAAGGIGLRIMRYRATSVGGTLTVEPAPGGGTMVTCTVRTTQRGQGLAES